MSLIYQYIDSLLNLTVAMSPYLLLGFLFAGLLKTWFPQKWIDRYMGKGNWRSAINTALLGIPLPLCSCGVIPTGISFYRNGASKGSSVSFLISTPQTGVDSILVTYSLLGLPFAIIRVIIALITGVLGGIFTNLIDSSNTKVSYTESNTKSSTTYTKGNIKTVFRYGFYEFLMDIAKWLIIGLIIAAFIDVIMPADFFNAHIKNEWLSMVMVLFASVPLYICATASVPIAAVLMLKGLSPGAALVLLMAGPATNAATITVMKKVFGNRTLLAYLGSIILGAMIFGALINAFLPREWFLIISDSMHHHQHELIPYWLQLASAIMLVTLIINGYIQKYLSKKKKAQTQSTSSNTILNSSHNIAATPSQSFSFAMPLITRYYMVEGMTCSHCKRSIETNLEKQTNITSVEASPENKEVKIEGTELNNEKIKELIEELGYNFIKEKI
ncbi:permease [Carboxylicivirga marina]|uniref:permease n=1 Tax=Carboxylicivirga marina TaxID=2800988 RepID=UPI002595137A|nr:permease [uncultured Carboxylicivirga sp.]